MELTERWCSFHPRRFLSPAEPDLTPQLSLKQKVGLETSGGSFQPSWSLVILSRLSVQQLVCFHLTIILEFIFMYQPLSKSLNSSMASKIYRYTNMHPFIVTLHCNYTGLSLCKTRLVFRATSTTIVINMQYYYLLLVDLNCFSHQLFHLTNW